MNISARASDVRVQEYVSLGSVIQNNSSSIGLLPVISARGSSTPKFFRNAADFSQEYGAPDPSISATVQSGLNFFTEGAGLWAFRAVGTNAKHSGLLVTTTSTGTLASVPTAIPDVDNALDLAPAGTETLLAFYPSRGQGSHGNALEIQIDASSAAITPVSSVTVTASGAGALTPETIYEYYVAPIMADGERNATKVVFTSPATYAGAHVLTWPAVASAIGYYVYGRTSANLGRLALVGVGDGATLTYTDAGQSVPSVGNKPITALSTTFQNRPFTVKVFDAGTQVESWECTLKPFVSAGGVQLLIEERINSMSRYVKVASNVPMLDKLPNMTSLTKTAMTGGTSGNAPTSSQIAESLEQFASRQHYNVNIIINGGLADPIIQRKMDQVAQRRGDCIALLDVPTGQQEWNNSIDYRNLMLGLHSSYSALFCQDQLQVSNDMQVYAPLSGWVAALCARTDRVATPAHSMAGLNRGRIPVLGSRYQYDDAQASAMFRAQVNYTRTFPTQGVVLWEQQTLGCDIRWLSVRRILNVIKTSLYTYLLYALQEMNTDSLRRELVNGSSDYLERAKLSEAIGDYRIICDGRNNNANTANAGVLVFSAVLIPLISVHEIILNVTVSQAGVSFQETVVPVGTSNTTLEFSSGPAPTSYGSSHITTEFSSGQSPSSYGSSNVTTQFSSGASPSGYGTSNTTIEYSSGVSSVPGGSSNTTNEYSSTRPF